MIAWIFEQTALLVESNFSALHEDTRIGVVGVVRECRNWGKYAAQLKGLKQEFSKFPSDDQNLILTGLLAHSRAFLREYYGYQPEVSEVELSWVKQSGDRLFSAITSEIPPPSSGKKITRRQLAAIISSKVSEWVFSPEFSDEGSWGFRRKSVTESCYLLSFHLAGRGNFLGYRLGFSDDGKLEVPLTYDRLVGLPGFLLPRIESDMLNPAIASILRESELVIANSVNH